MNTQSDPQNELSRALQKICEITEKSADGDYIFRGEPKHYPKVSSDLYREYQYDIEVDNFEIEVVQKEILDEAKKHLNKTDEFEILIELLDYGVKTNLIDFTTDLHIALFFACDGSPSEDGRVILQKRESVAGYLEQPRKPKNRIIAQKSIFVRPPKGFINPDEVITIPADLKLSMLEYLRKYHDISTETIYNDFHGFMTNRSIHEGAYTQFHKGRASQKRGDAAQNWNEKLVWYERAVVHYTEALELKPDFAEAYNNRGSVYTDAGDFDRAIQDYHKVIELKPDYVSAYNNLGIAYSRQNEYDRAIHYYNEVIKLKPDFAEAYSNRGVTYEKKGEYDKAVENHNKAIELKPDFAEAYYNLGVTYREMGDQDQEFQNYTTAIELKPDFTLALGNRGIIYALRGDDDKAIEDYTMAITLDQNDANVYFNRGISYGAKDDYRKAIEDYSYTIALKSDYAEAYCNRGEAWLHLKEWKKAKADLITARDKGVDIIAAFHNDYESVADFEQKNDLQLPEDIALMLTQQ